ncbi:MAG: FlgD immunoglobulin-like domain containing protein, partial [Candidatus Margulisbacteria bacterium]|nr:FlgD immunoglobulin-like domain containing protein [Candidatus Margulisiibacteriota bacterium]
PSASFKVTEKSDAVALKALPLSFKLNDEKWTTPQSAEAFAFQLSEGANTINVKLMDKAGNVITSSFVVTLDEVAPTVTTFSIVISHDVSRDFGEEPIADEHEIWYNKDLIQGYVTWDSSLSPDDSLVTENIFIKGNKTNSFESIGFINTSATFAIQVIPGRTSPVSIMAFIRDKAGNIQFASANVYVNTDKPGMGEVFIVPDTANDGWFHPKSGYYDQLDIDCTWTEPTGILRAKPYQVRSSLTFNWTVTQSSTEYNGYTTTIGNQEIIVKAIDKAGNIATFSAWVTVDLTAPATADAYISPDVDSLSDGFGPILGYYDNQEIIVTWQEVEDQNLDFYMILTHDIRNLTADIDVNSYKISTNIKEKLVTVSNQGINTLSVIAVDEAGNYSVKLLTVNLDTIAPSFSFVVNEKNFVEISQDVLIITISSWESISRGSDALFITLNLDVQDGEKKEYRLTVNQLSEVLFTTTMDTSVANVSDNKATLEFLLVDNAGNVSTYSMKGIEFRRKKPKDPIFNLRNPNNESIMYTNTLNVSVNCSYSEYLTLSWNITFNVETRPSENDSLLWGTYPSTFVIPSSSQGLKTVYLWAKNDSGTNLNAVSASIVYDNIPPTCSLEKNDTWPTVSYGEYNFILNVSDHLAQAPTASIVFSELENKTGTFSVRQIDGLRYSLGYSFTETSVNGIITLDIEMVDRAGNTSSVISGWSTLNLQMNYPPTPSIRFSQIDDPRRIQYINTTNIELLSWIAVSAENDTITQYLITYNNNLRPRSNYGGWRGVSSSVQSTDDIYGDGVISTWNIKRLTVDYSEVVNKYGLNGQRFLTTDIYVWVRDEKGNVSEKAAMQSLTIDIDVPVDTISFNYLDDTSPQRITFNIFIDEAVTINKYWIEFAYDSAEASKNLTTDVSIRNFILTVDLTSEEKSLHPVLRRQLVDLAGNTLNATTELQPKLYVITINMSTNTANRRDEMLRLLDINISPSTVITLDSFTMEKVGDNQNKSVEQLYLKLNGQRLATANFVAGTENIRFLFNPINITANSVLSIYGDILSSALEPFAFRVTTASFALDVYNKVSSNILTHTTNYYVIGNGWNVLHVYRESNIKTTPNIVYPNDKDVVLFKFEMNTYPYNVALNKIVFNRHEGNDLLSVESLENVRLYYESDEAVMNEVFDPGDSRWLELVLGKIDKGQQTITFQDFSKVISSKKIRIFVVADISIDALSGKNIALEFRTTANFDVGALSLINESTLPLCSDTTQMGSYRQRMKMTYAPFQRGEVHQGASIKFGELIISNDYYSTPLSQINLRVSYNNIDSLGSSPFVVSFNNQRMSNLNTLTKINGDYDALEVPFPGSQYLIEGFPHIMGLGVDIANDAITGSMSIKLYPSDLKELVAPAIILNTENLTMAEIIVVDKSQPIISGAKVFDFVNRPDLVTFDLDCSVNDNQTSINSVQVALFRLVAGTEENIGTSYISLNKNAKNNKFELRNITLDRRDISNLSLLHGYQYLIKLRAKSSKGEAIFTSSELVLTFNIDLTPPMFENAGLLLHQVDDPEATSDTHRLSWSPAYDPESTVRYYTIEYQRGTSQKWNHEATINATSYTIANRDKDLRYRYRVNAVNGARLNSNWITSEYSTVAKPKDSIYNVSFYPNPVNAIANEKGTFYYELKEDSNVSLKIYDALGHFVREMNYRAGASGGQSSQPNKVEWDATDSAGRKVSKGGYFVVINSVSESTGLEGNVRLMVGVIH